MYQLTPRQMHLLGNTQYLDEDKGAEFKRHLKTIDWEEVDERWSDSREYIEDKEEEGQLNYDRTPLERRFSSLDLIDADHVAGSDALKSGNVCIVTLAGGQASRLGADVPKGIFPLDLGFENPLHCTLLYLQACQYKRLKMITKADYVEWIIMTSKSTDNAIRAEMEKICADINIDFSSITFCVQKEIPCYDETGCVLLDGDRVKTAPNGNGGFFEAIETEIPRLHKNGIRYFHVYCVDNILAFVGDPQFIGFCINRNADCAAKVVYKREPTEKIGVITSVPRARRSYGRRVDRYLLGVSPEYYGREVRVIEYSELTQEQANMVEPANDELTFCDGNIANHFFSMEFAIACCEYELPYHIAKKNIKHFSLKENKEITTAGIKLERFIFDVFPIARNFLSYEVERKMEFAPLKNPDSAGVDCPTSCRDALIAAHEVIIDDACMTKKILETEYGPRYVSRYGILSPLLTYSGEFLDVINSKKPGVINPVGGITLSI